MDVRVLWWWIWRIALALVVMGAVALVIGVPLSLITDAGQRFPLIVAAVTLIALLLIAGSQLAASQRDRNP